MARNWAEYGNVDPSELPLRTESFELVPVSHYDLHGTTRMADTIPDWGNYDISDFMHLNNNPVMIQNGLVSIPNYTHSTPQISSTVGTTLEVASSLTTPKVTLGTSYFHPDSSHPASHPDHVAIGYYNSDLSITRTNANAALLQPSAGSSTVDGGSSLFPTSNSLLLPLNVSTTTDLREFVHPKKRRERAGVDDNAIASAFTSASVNPDPGRRALFEEILKSSFYQRRHLEPLLGTSDASEILSAAGVSSLANEAPPNVSIFFLFVDRETSKCLICNKTFSASDRLLGCIRKHFQHRPFRCPSNPQECRTCSVSEPARFFTASALRDHLGKQQSLDQCPFSNCGTRLRIGGIRRHYTSMHPTAPVPDMKVERARERNASSRNAISSDRYTPY